MKPPLSDICDTLAAVKGSGHTYIYTHSYKHTCTHAHIHTYRYHQIISGRDTLAAVKGSVHTYIYTHAEADREYEPYDQKAAKIKWAQKVIRVHKKNHERWQEEMAKKRRKARRAAGKQAKTVTKGMLGKKGEVQPEESDEDEEEEEEEEDTELDPAALWELFEKNQMPRGWINGEPY
jgi:hypothetical protein